MEVRHFRWKFESAQIQRRSAGMDDSVERAFRAGKSEDLSMQKLDFSWRYRKLGMKDNFQSLRLLAGAAVVLTLFGTVSPASAKDEQGKQQHQVQKEQKKAAQQQSQANRNFIKQARNDNKQAQNQTRNQAHNEQRNQAAQNEQRNQAAQNKARSEERNRAGQNQAVLNQAQENRRQNERAVKNADKKRKNETYRALNQQRNEGSKANWNDYKKNEKANIRANNQAYDREQHQTEIKRENERVAAQERAKQRARLQSTLNQNANRPGYRPDKRWDYKLSERERYQKYKKYRNNWNEQRTYLKSNLNKFNEIADLNRQQQALLDNQMRAAYLQYHNNQYKGAYTWDTYSDPQFIDYIQTRNPSLMQSILGFLGLGDNGDYLYSSNWEDERNELSHNMANIHQLELEGRITPAQERILKEQMKQEFLLYHNNSWKGTVGWSQYSDPGFVDYLNRKKPSILMTVRDYLVR